MRERPILFSSAMVLALLAGRKTQTRRAVKPMPGVQSKWLTPALLQSARMGAVMEHQGCMGWQMDHPDGGALGWIDCPYGNLGDRLWVKETWRPREVDQWSVEVAYAADGAMRRHADGDTDFGDWNMPKAAKTGNVTPLFMPRWASRLTLEVTGVRVERLNDIDGSDAIAEGIERGPLPPSTYRVSAGWRDYGFADLRTAGGPIDSFRSLWESINGADSWKANPWVWAISFEVLR